METLVRYDQSSASINWKQKLVGATRVDNSASVSPATLQFTAESSSSTTASVTVTSTTKGELNLMIGKVDQTVSIGGTLTRNWTQGYKYGVSTTVPAHTIGKVTAYILGTTTNGNAVYKVQNTYDGSYFYSYRARGAIVPSENTWNIVTQIPCL